jgi:DNA polymerase I
LPPELRSWYSIAQGALKVILNASYGVFGADSFDLYCPPVAEATAAIGRHSIMQILGHAETVGIQVLMVTLTAFLLLLMNEKLGS